MTAKETEKTSGATTSTRDDLRVIAPMHEESVVLAIARIERAQAVLVDMLVHEKHGWDVADKVVEALILVREATLDLWSALGRNDHIDPTAERMELAARVVYQPRAGSAA